MASVALESSRSNHKVELGVTSTGLVLRQAELCKFKASLIYEVIAISIRQTAPEEQ